MIKTKNKLYPHGVEVVGSTVIENIEGKILLVKSPKWHNKWTMPGGHVEPGEKIEDALLREAKEEAGLKDLVSRGVFVSGEIINSKDFYRPAHFIFFDSYCTTAESNVVLDNEELFEYVWVRPEEALKMDLAESYDFTIIEFQKYKNKLNKNVFN